MRRYWCLSTTFLEPRFHGRGDGGNPEWPPSPLRLFQALVSAAKARWRDGAFTQMVAPALTWLEQQSQSQPPLIVAPAVDVGQAYRLSVPNNAMDIVAKHWARGNEPPTADAPSKHRTMKTVRPTCLKGGQTVHFLWELPDMPAPEILHHLETLSIASRSLVALGWGIDLIVGDGRVISADEMRGLPGERWAPVNRSGFTTLRNPTVGTLAALERRHENFLCRISADGGFTPVPPLGAFHSVGYSRESDRAARPCAAFQLLHPETGKLRAFAFTRTAVVAAMVRHAVGEVAATAQHTEVGFSAAGWLNQYVHGHDRTNETKLGRFAYLPLPTIDHRDVVSSVRRVLIAEPHDGLGTHADWVRRAVRGQPLVDEITKTEEAILGPLGANDYVFGRYVASARNWATVTPVVLPWGDSGKPHRAEKQFLKAIRHAGYSPDSIDEFELRREPFWRGIDLARNYFVPRHLRGTATYHVRLRWKHKIHGPLAVGSGRFCGLGLFASQDK